MGSFQQRREAHLRKQYGISQRDYDWLFEVQEGRCAICGTADPGNGKGALSVDHDHQTGAVRGLLCSGCNTGIGHFQDDVAILEEAIAYLKRSKEVSYGEL